MEESEGSQSPSRDTKTLKVAKARPDWRTEARSIHAHTFCRPAMGEQKNTNGDIGSCSRSNDAEEGRISLCCSLGQGFMQPLCGLEHADSDLPARLDLRSSGRYQHPKAFFRIFDSASRFFRDPSRQPFDTRPARRP